ncbi:hypothetical protein PFISCL1PPCAC_8253, partial [Pristionchus fissidentatus]
LKLVPLLLLLAVAAYANQFDCPADTILRFGVEKRVKELQKDCTVHAQPGQELLCESTAELEKAWKEFVETADEYSKAVKSCRETVERNKQRAGSPVRRRRAHKHDHDDGHDHHDREDGHKHRRDVDHDPTDPNIDHSGHNHAKRHAEHDPNDPNVDHTGHNHSRRSADHDPADPNIDHTGHNHAKRHADHDPNDPNVDHTGHNHRRRSVDDPNDTTIDHTGHNHQRRHADHDPTDPNIDHTGHNHAKRHADHDPNDPNVDHTGHNHRTRRCQHQHRGYREDGSNPCNPPDTHGVHQRHTEDDDRIIRREQRAVDTVLSRVRRGDCSVAGNQELHKLQDKYVKHCERTNICLPDEDLGANAAEDFKKLHKKHAGTYAAYVRELSACYGSLKN